MLANPYSVEKLRDLRQSKARAVVFLVRKGETSIDAYAVFRALKPKTQMMLKSRFEYWIGGGRFDDYFHGWPNIPAHKDCFEFKWNEGPRRRRFYGFLMHPLAANLAFKVCVLAIHRYKNTRRTDPRNLDLMVTLLNNNLVVSTIRETLAEEEAHK